MIQARFNVMGLVVCGSFLAGLVLFVGFWGVVFYVAIHYISKYW